LTTHMIAHPAQMEAGGSAEILARPIGIVSHPFGINTIMMTPTEREYVITQFAQTRDLVKQTFGGLSAPQLLYRPASGGWSAAENLEHLIVVERRVFAGIERLLQQPPDPAKRPAMTDEQIVAIVGKVVEPVKAPPQALPTSQWPPEQLLPEFEKARQKTSAFAAASDGDLRRRFLPHYLYGDFDCYQWLVLLSAHCRRHCAQSEQVKASPGFPR